MGLLDRWSKRKKQERLEKTDEKKEQPVVKDAESKKKEKSPENTAPVALAREDKKEKESVLAKRVLVKPIVTEKAAVAESLNKYSFLVSRSANKYQIKQAILEQYGIKPKNVNVVNTEGKRVRFGRTSGRHSDYRKAVVTLPKGKTISIHKGV